MNAAETMSEAPIVLRTTLLDLVQSLNRRDLTPDEVVRNVHQLIDRNEVVLIGNFREGLGRAPAAAEASGTPVHHGEDETFQRRARRGGVDRSPLSDVT